MGRGKPQCVRGADLDFFQRDLIVAAHFDLRAQFADVLDEVVGEGIVVIEDENQGRGAPITSLHRRAGWPERAMRYPTVVLTSAVMT